MLNHIVNFSRPKTSSCRYNLTPNKKFKVIKSKTITNDSHDCIIKEQELRPNINQEYLVRTLYRFKPVSFKKPLNNTKHKIDKYNLPNININRPFSCDVKYKDINIIDKVKESIIKDNIKSIERSKEITKNVKKFYIFK
jgi:hypothetical protein